MRKRFVTDQLLIQIYNFMNFLKINYILHCERSGKSDTLKKEIEVLLRASLFLGKWCGVATYFLYKKIRKNKYKLHDQNILNVID